MTAHDAPVGDLLEDVSRQTVATNTLRAARDHGLKLWRDGDLIRMSAPSAPPAELLQAVRRCKSELLNVLDGKRCSHCAGRINWRMPPLGHAAICFVDGTAAHLSCHEKAEVACMLAAAERGAKPSDPNDPAERTNWHPHGDEPAAPTPKDAAA